MPPTFPRHRYALIIPALNEAETIGVLLGQIPASLFEVIVVVDNGSLDSTAQVAAAAGARVVREPRHGYGQACQAGLASLDPQVTGIVFMDADLSDDPADLGNVIREFEQRDLDLLIGSRTLGLPEPGSLTPLQRFGNWLSTCLIALLWGVRFTDLGPLRAVRRDALMRLRLRDPGFGWNVEMQARAAQLQLKVGEIPVRYRRRRSGRSKISGTFTGSLRAGAKILWTLGRCYCVRSGAAR
jgi:glycosyltransferase involved in cell wall biosynthesis